MINTFRSNTSNSATERLIDEIGKNNVPGSRHLVICPSNYGFTLEKLIHERLGLAGSFNIDITSFSRYSYKKLQFVKTPIGTEGSVLLVKKVALEKKKELKHYFRVVENINFAVRMYNTLKLMKLNGYNANIIRAKAANMTGATGDKLFDIAIILEAFEKEIFDKYTDTATRLEMLKKQVESDEDIKKTHVYFTGFSDFSVLELAVFEAFSRKALSVNVSMVSGKGAPNEGYFPTRIANQISNLNLQNNLIGEETDTLEILRSSVDILHKNLLSYQPVTLNKIVKDEVFVYAENNVYEELNGVAHEIIRLVRREGYRYKDINIINASPDYAPVMTQIFERYDIPCYVDIKFPLSQALSASFLLLATEAAKFSYRRDKVIALIKHPLFINSRLAMNTSQDGSVKADIFLYENHILKNNINFADFKEEDISAEGGRFEYIRKRLVSIIERFSASNIDRAGSSEKLESEVVENIESKILNKYEERETESFDGKDSYNYIETIYLGEMLRKEGQKTEVNEDSKNRKQMDVKEYIAVCRGLLEESTDTLNNIVTKHRAGQARKEGTIEEINIRANKILEELFVTAEQIIGEEKGDISMFDQYLKTLISQQSIAMIPRYLDSVFVGDLTTSYITRPKIVFVIGASSSNLLSGKVGASMLNPKDTQMMENENMPIYPTDKDLIMHERYYFIDLISKVQKKFYIGYSLNNLKGEGQKPSEAITEIINITGIKPESLSLRYSLDNALTKEDLENVGCSPANTFFTYVANKESIHSAKDPIKVLENLSSLKNSLPEELIKSLPENLKEEECIPDEKNYADYFFVKQASGNYKLSSSALETFFACPYLFFLKYGLGVKDREVGSFDPASIGTLVHAVLQEYFGSINKLKKDYKSLTAEEIDTYGNEAIEKAFSKTEGLIIFAKDPESKLKIDNLIQECKNLISDLTENVGKGDYRPLHFEEYFVYGEKPDSGICLEDGKKLCISGIIDRVDVAEIEGEGKRAIVVDYKTGGASTKGDIKNIYSGIEIQPYIYIMGLREKHPEYIPAGGVYLVLAENLNKDGKSYRFKGQIVTDIQNFMALDQGCFLNASSGEKSSSTVLPFDLKTDKQGDVVPATSLYPISDLSKMEKMTDWVKGLIKEAFVEINKGCFEKSPHEGKGCDNCFLKGACTGAEDKDYRLSITNTGARDIFNKYFAS
jgi:ATP-dependent helicase/nuclease subunit B